MSNLLTAGRRLGVALLLALLALWLWSSTATATAPQGDVVLVLEGGTTPNDAFRAAGNVQGTVVASIPQLHAYLVDLPGSGKPALAVLARLETDRAVEDAEAVQQLSLAAFTVNDPYIGSAWHLAKIRADLAWTTTMGSAAVRIAIVDTGIDYNHPDLSGKVIQGPDYGSGDWNPRDTQGHGTHVAGIAAAKANNGIGAAGVCPSCTLMAVKVFPDGSSSASHFAIAQGITWAADNGADVINLSLGGSSISSLMQNAVDYAWSHGAVVVAAAGNSATSTPHYPAGYANAVAVGSTTSTDALSSFSNFGSWVDVTAPGSTILSTLRNGGYGYMSGTSMASPVVAGAAGLAFSGLAGATNATVRAAVEAAVADLGAPGKDTTFGFGRTDTALFFGGGGGGGGGTPAAPSVTTSTLPGGTVGTSYSASLAASGGTAPYTWSLSSGTLPNGLTLSSGGALGGTPTAAGTSSFTVRVTDANGQIGTRALSIAVTAPPSTPGTADLTGSWTKAKKGTGKVKGDYSLVVSGASASGVVVRFQLFANGFLVSQQDRHLGTLTPGTRLIEIEFIGTWPGTLTVRAIVDPSGAIAESNELNNQADRAVQN